MKRFHIRIATFCFFAALVGCEKGGTSGERATAALPPRVPEQTRPPTEDGTPGRNEDRRTLATPTPTVGSGTASVMATASPTPEPEPPVVLPSPAPRPVGEPDVRAPEPALVAAYEKVCESANAKISAADPSGPPPTLTADELTAQALFTLASVRSCTEVAPVLASREWIDFSDRGLSSSTFLALLPKARTLLLQRNRFATKASLEGLSALRGLRTVSLSGNPLGERGALAPLATLKWLETLSLSETALPANSYGVLTAFGNLKQLHLRNVPLSVSDLRAVGALSRLEVLDLSGSRITRVPASADGAEREPLALLGNLVRLKDVDVSSTGATHLAFLARATRAIEIRASGNAVAGLPDAPEWDALQALVLSENPLSRLTPLAPAPGRSANRVPVLRTLILEATAFDDVETAARLKSLAYFNFKKTPAAAAGRKCPLDDWDACEN